MENYNEIKINFEKFINTFKTDDNDLEFRKKSFANFISKGFPISRDENWKYSPLVQDLKKFSHLNNKKTGINALPNALKENFDHYSIIFVDGVLILTDINDTGLVIKKNNSFLKSVKKAGENPILNLNNAFADQGYLIELSSNTILTRPIVIYNYFSKNFLSSFCSSKNFILLNEKSNVVVYEKTIYDSSIEYLITSNTEIFLAKGSKLKKYDLNCNNKYSTIFNFVKANLDENSELEYFTFSENINSCRDESIINLNGKNCFANVNAIQLLRNNCNHEIKLQINHNEEHTKSSQFVKSALYDSANAIFQGKIFVDSKAQKTDGYQLSRALLLSDNVKFFSKPELEIYADDVKCSHGSSSGSVDEESIFYLRSRGISKEDAKMMMINGFLGEVIEKITEDKFKNIFFNKLDHYSNHD